MSSGAGSMCHILHNLSISQPKYYGNTLFSAVIKDEITFQNGVEILVSGPGCFYDF